MVVFSDDVKNKGSIDERSVKSKWRKRSLSFGISYGELGNGLLVVVVDNTLVVLLLLSFYIAIIL